jgi:hypothetical protein
VVFFSLFFESISGTDHKKISSSQDQFKRLIITGRWFPDVIMDNEFVISKHIEIHSSPPQVWDVLINPDKISRYFIGAETITDWQTGSEILFHHEYEGEQFTNKGRIIAFRPKHFFSLILTGPSILKLKNCGKIMQRYPMPSKD